MSQVKALRATRIGVFAALYAATSLIPISTFIGAPSFLSLNLIITPVIAILLSPMEAFTASLFGGIIAMYIAPFQAMFGPFTILLPVAGSTLGSLAYHKPKTGVIISGYLVTVAFFYLIARPEFPYWIILHVLAAIFAITFCITKSPPLRAQIPIYAFISTISEQGAMLMCAVYVLSLPWIVFATAFLLMLYERVIGTIGGSLITYSLLKAAPEYFSKISSD